MAVTKGLGTTGNSAGVVTPLDHKLAQAGLIAKTGAGTNLIRPGVFYDGVSNIVTGTANMSYDVAAFTAVTTRGATAGAVLLANDGTVNVATTAAPGSNSRIDSVYVWPREFSLDGVDSTPVIAVAQGVAAASPVAPSLAAFPGAIELARIIVPAGVTATNSGTTITQLAPFTTVDGTTLVRRTTTERDAISTPLVGLRCRVLADGITYAYSGSTWLPADSGAIAIRVTRATNTPALSTAYVNLSANANWLTTTPAAQNKGFAAYSNGITVPVTGVYRVGYSLASAASLAFLAGVTVNKNAAVGFTDFEVISTAAVAQGVAATSASEEIRLAASDVLRLYAIATSGTPSLSASLGSFYCEWLRAD